MSCRIKQTRTTSTEKRKDSSQKTTYPEHIKMNLMHINELSSFARSTRSLTGELVWDDRFRPQKRSRLNGLVVEDRQLLVVAPLLLLRPNECTTERAQDGHDISPSHESPREGGWCLVTGAGVCVEDSFSCCIIRLVLTDQGISPHLTTHTRGDSSP